MATDRPIFHLALPDEWAQALVDGRYERSSRGRSLANEGFIHASFAEQLEATAGRYYADLDELVLLAIDADVLDAEVVVEPAPSGERYPHIYGPIPVGAVTATPVRRSGAAWSFG